MHGHSHGALDVAVVSQVGSLLFHNDNMSHCRRKARRQTYEIAIVGCYPTICMGISGSPWAKPPSAQ
eukprot:3688882-Amphidinium_carterae.1